MVGVKLDIDARDLLLWNRPCEGIVASGGERGENTGIKNWGDGRQDTVEIQRECGRESIRRAGTEAAMFCGE